MRVLRRAVCLGVLALFAACGGGDDGNGGGSDDTPTLTIWWAQWDPAVGLQELADDFSAETGIQTTVHQIPWGSYQDQVFLEFGSNETSFDIVIGDSQWIGRGATKGLYLELTDWLKDAVDLDSVHPKALQALCEYPAGSGRYYGAPCETDAVGLAYRKDWFEDPAEQQAFQEQHGRALTVPTTWDEFRQVAEFFHRPDDKRYGCVLLTGRPYDCLTMGFQQMMWSFGGSWGDPATHKTQGLLNGPEAVAGLQFFVDLLPFAPLAGKDLDYGPNADAFTNGSSAMMLNYFAFFPSVNQKMGDKAGFAVAPSHGDRHVISLGGQGFSISNKVSAERQDRAKQFIAWFLTEDIQRQWIQKPAGFTAHTGVLASEEFRAASPYNTAFAESLDHLQDFWNLPVYNELLAESQKYVGEALDGVKTPQEALDALGRGPRTHLPGRGSAGRLSPPCCAGDSSVPPCCS